MSEIKMASMCVLGCFEPNTPFHTGEDMLQEMLYHATVERTSRNMGLVNSFWEAQNFNIFKHTVNELAEVVERDTRIKGMFPTDLKNDYTPSFFRKILNLLGFNRK